MIDAEKIYMKDLSMVSRKIGDDFLLIPIRKSTKELNHIFTMNKVSACIWELIDGKNRLSDILKMINAEYDVDPQTTTTDLNEFVQKLINIKAIREL
jgi:hypothetical protein